MRPLEDFIAAASAQGAEDSITRPVRGIQVQVLGRVTGRLVTRRMLAAFRREFTNRERDRILAAYYAARAGH